MRIVGNPIGSDRLHVVTGTPGSGKSTLVAALSAAGVATSEEIGRQVIREQVAAHEAALARGVSVVLDRGVPDVVAFLRASRLPVPPAIDAAARRCRYNPCVFLAPFWAAIFVRDAERPRPSSYARATHDVMIATYRDYGYDLVELPLASVATRVAFVRERIGAAG